MSSSWMDISDFAVFVPKLSSVGNLPAQDSYLASGGRIRLQDDLLLIKSVNSLVGSQLAMCSW